MKRRTVNFIRIHRSPIDHCRGLLVAGSLRLPCALGRTGLIRLKREGDGGTPTGRCRVLGIMYRADRVRRPASTLPVRTLRPRDGWCDDPSSQRYNRPMLLPSAARHERMFRDDGVYNIVLDLDWNRRRRTIGRGSAIFLHLARPGFPPTEGCIAVAPAFARTLVQRIGRETWIVTGP